MVAVTIALTTATILAHNPLGLQEIFFSFVIQEFTWIEVKINWAKTIKLENVMSDFNDFF